ncbi:MAG: hypothetical protein A2W80_05745 [Candidatus Riflebacteria bacterium GWC2_50_8]|nr:MAG: hypothetical protein A2W80_05745 [Candidatus Riflebacteria bacterium GWC2_50_8]
MTSKKSLADELKHYSCICYYPSSGTDLSDIDYFASGRKLWSERVEGVPVPPAKSGDKASLQSEPDLYIHTDVNFYQEFSAGHDLDPEDCAIHGSFEVIEFRELPRLEKPNRICDNFDYSGKCFEYKLRVWGSEKTLTLIYCLCENESFVADILLAHGIKVEYVWSRNWYGTHTYGTWLANILDQTQTRKVYTDWLCVPGKRGEPQNIAVQQKYPELMVPARVKLVRNEDIRWIDESGHGWVEEFDVLSTD